MSTSPFIGAGTIGDLLKAVAEGPSADSPDSRWKDNPNFKAGDGPTQAESLRRFFTALNTNERPVDRFKVGDLVEVHPDLVEFHADNFPAPGKPAVVLDVNIPHYLTINQPPSKPLTMADMVVGVLMDHELDAPIIANYLVDSRYFRLWPLNTN